MNDMLEQISQVDAPPLTASKSSKSRKSNRRDSSKKSSLSRRDSESKKSKHDKHERKVKKRQSRAVSVSTSSSGSGSSNNDEDEDELPNSCSAKVKNCLFFTREDDGKSKVIADEKIGELSQGKLGEQELMDQKWDDFKGDVSMKTLISQLDTSIKRRRRLYYTDDETENARI